MTSNKKFKKIVSANGVTLGLISGNELRKIYDKKFILHKPVDSLCCPKEALDLAEQQGVGWVVFTDKETGTQYKATLGQFKAAEIINFGYGDQYRLPISAFILTSKRGATGEEHKQLRQKQLSFFGGTQ